MMLCGKFCEAANKINTKENIQGHGKEATFLSFFLFPWATKAYLRSKFYLKLNLPLKREAK